ncbi:hypothetical protein TWF481_003020 [Arthrobotrys musiformis]|uniref:Uncharacterized protein n=1 Tax=Arthrobotrys musiformis TaxID=47236 RepID=A0AAV9VS36_9PEZI
MYMTPSSSESGFSTPLIQQQRDRNFTGTTDQSLLNKLVIFDFGGFKSLSTSSEYETRVFDVVSSATHQESPEQGYGQSYMSIARLSKRSQEILNTFIGVKLFRCGTDFQWY